jgi:methylglutaconyl-CoA hydratase
VNGLTVGRDGSVLRLVLDDPGTRNALSVTKLAVLRAVLDRVWDDPSVRVVVLTGAGGVFSSGWDREAGGTADHAVGRLALLDTYAAVANCRVPVIAEVAGAAFGAAVGLIGSCDLAVADEQAVFCLPEARFGGVAFPAMVPCLARWRIADAARFLLTGERFTGAQAAASGLVTAAVPLDALTATVEDMVGGVLACAPGSVAATKRILRRLTRGTDAPFAHAAAWADAVATDEATEGISAWRERRPPAWTPEASGAL